jgi:AraC-like DNA-binding protein
MAEKNGIGDAYLCRLFKENFNITIAEFIIAKRVERAKELLTDRDGRVIDIACHSGFNNLSYFHRIFKMLEGITPLEYGFVYAPEKLVG